MRRNPILLKDIYGKNTSKSKTIIGIIGTHQGVGVTHTSIMLANYFRGVLGYKTALLEMNMHHDMECIERMYEEDIEYLTEEPFQIRKVMYYKCVKERDLADIFNEDFDFYICDYGFDLKRGRNEFLRCDRKIVVGSLADWKREKLYNFADKWNGVKGLKTWNYLAVFGEEKQAAMVRKLLKIPLKIMPYNPNPYILLDEVIQIFRGIC